MNLAIRGIEGNLGSEPADSFHRDLHKDLKADYILANPPFNMSDWGGERLREDVRWKFGVPPAGNANYAWVQHFLHHLAPNGHGRVRPRQRQHVLQPIRRRRNPQGHHRSRPRGLHGRSAGPTFLLDADSRLPVVSRPRQIRKAGTLSQPTQRRVKVVCSLMPGKSARMIDRVHRDLTKDDIAKNCRHVSRVARRQRCGQI